MPTDEKGQEDWQMRGESSSSVPFPKPPSILYYSPNLLVPMYHLGEECLASTKKNTKIRKKQRIDPMA